MALEARKLVLKLNVELQDRICSWYASTSQGAHIREIGVGGPPSLLLGRQVCLFLVVFQGPSDLIVVKYMNKNQTPSGKIKNINIRV